MEQLPSFRERLKQRPTKGPLDGSEELWCFREAAAVLANFDVEALQPHGPVSLSSSAKTELLADCDISHNADGTPTWSLRTSVRHAALRRLIGSNGIESALASNPDRPRGVSQDLFEAYLLGERPVRAATGTVQEARAILKIAEWLEGIPELSRTLPPVEIVKQQLARYQLLQPFRELVGSFFAGRSEELSLLSDYVGFYRSAHVSEALSRTVEYVFSIHDRPPLFVHGPGGCGKSTLIAKFILEHAEVDIAGRFPFAYLDFDRPGLLAEEPVTLLLEVMRQLVIQFPESTEAYQRLAEDWELRIAEQRSDETTSDSAVMSMLREKLSEESARTLQVRDRSEFIVDFSKFLLTVKRDEQSFLLVLDTFEEVQFRSAAFVDQTFEFLNQLQRQVPRLRTVLCGRADIISSKFKVRQIEIGNFDEEAAAAFLMGLGVGDPQVGRKIFAQVGGNPLVLRLAADVAQLESVDQAGIDGLRTGWLALFREKSIEIVLYKRILSHIRDKRVEQLAYPGLVLRVITPEVIQNVLAPACGVIVNSQDDAHELLSIMRAQLSTILMSNSGDESVLIHRADMRSILLHDLANKAPSDPVLANKLNRIHNASIEFYSKFDDASHRAEEIYHRLALGVDRKTLASRWRDGLRPYLGSSILELPPAGQIYLAARLNLELSPDLWNQAEDEDWVLYANRLALQQLQVGRPFEAFNVLSLRRQVWGHKDVRPVLRLVVDEVFHEYGAQYESIRETQPSGDVRTRKMNSLMNKVATFSSEIPLDQSFAQRLYDEKRPGSRVVALSILERNPISTCMSIAIDAIENALSPFEQYHGLLVARLLLARATREDRKHLHRALMFPKGTPIHSSDSSRVSLKNELLERIEMDAGSSPDFFGYHLADVQVAAPVTYSDDRGERHGPFVSTRGKHRLDLPHTFRIGLAPVTNQEFMRFVEDGAYFDDELWMGGARKRYLTRDGKTAGPATWRSKKRFSTKEKNHPVAGVCYVEAIAFVTWLNRRFPDPDWLWCLPTEDMWEFAARSSKGFAYPWGNEFLPDRCNSIESGIKTTSDVSQFPEGQSVCGCVDMAGNVWEFVSGQDETEPETCVLRGGSFKNNEYEIKSYLRLVQVPVDLRASDFGIRCAQVPRSYVDSVKLGSIYE